MRAGSGRRVRPVDGALLAVIVSAGLFLLGHLPRDRPLIPALNFSLPRLTHHAAAASSAPGRMRLPAAVSLGSFLTLHGTLPPDETGIVSVEGAYGRPPWQVFATVPGTSGSYTARIRLEHRGLLHLRVTYPDGRRSVGSVRVS